MRAEDLQTDVTDAVKELAEAIAEKSCILFLGAGVHAPPPAGSRYQYEEGQLPLTGTSLSERLAKLSRFEENEGLAGESPLNLARTSMYCELEWGRARLIQTVREAVQDGKQPSPLLHALAGLDFPVVMTTNYDQLFEQALRAHGKQAEVAVYQPDRNRPTKALPDPRDNAPLLIKVHGDIDTPESVVITDEDYIHFMMRMNDPLEFNPLPLAFRYHFTRYPTLFVGYSLLDFNLRVLFRAMRWKADSGSIPETFALVKRRDPLIYGVWWERNRYVRFVVTNAWAFVPVLYERVRGEAMPA